MPEPSPRAFATASGFVFQIAGLILAGGGCCLWSFSGYLQEPDPEVAGAPAAAVAGPWVQRLEMFDLVGTFAGGLALIAAGLGLQAERPRSGRTALVITAALGGLWWISLGAYLWAGEFLPHAVLAAILACICTLFFLLAGVSHRTLLSHPPPADQNVVTDAELEAMRRSRHRNPGD